MDIKAVQTKPFLDQKLGTSGLRKKVSVFKQPHYLQNLIQSAFDSMRGFEGKTLIIGGDGRYFNHQAIQIILKMAIANQFGRIIIGQDGILSTPAASYLIQKYQAFGGIILSASHNPGGVNGDFGIKFNVSTGAPAPQSLANTISERTRTIDRYWCVDIPDIDLSVVRKDYIGSTEIQIIDSVADYVSYMQEIFDFEELKKLFSSGFRMIFDSMNAVTGPYAVRIFEELLGAPQGTVIHAKPLPDFGGLHPEPNLTYAKHLVDLMYDEKAPDFAAASDGDGDRYMILGKSFFVNPSDSLAIMMQYLHQIPFYQGRIYGVARSMPTSMAVDYVAYDASLPCYETPTGWKFFGSLLDAKKITICGEESFGAGSFHIREKDGLWAVLFWLSILAKTKKTPQELTQDLWTRYGRVYCSTHSYEGVDSDKANTLMEKLNAQLNSLPGRSFGTWTITQAYNFCYTDPVTEETVPNQGICLIFKNQARIIYRLSGTGSSGATLRVYYNRLVNDANLMQADAQTVLSDLIQAGLSVVPVTALIDRKTPSVIT